MKDSELEPTLNPVDTDTAAQPASEQKEQSVPLSKRSVDGNPFRQISSYLWNNQSRKTYTLLTMTFGFISVLIFFAILPTLVSITQIVKKIEEYKKVEASQSQKVGLLNDLVIQSENSINSPTSGLNEYISFLDTTFIPNLNAQEVVYRDFMAKIDQAGVILENIKTAGDSPTDYKNAKAVQYRFVVKSESRVKLQALLTSLATSQRLYRIQKVNMAVPVDTTTTQSDGSAATFSVDITLLAYYYV